MTPQEQQMIDGLVARIRSTPVNDKDLVADRYLQGSLAGSPDAIYILAQTVLVQQYGLQQAQDQLRQAQDQISGLQAQVDQLQAQLDQLQTQAQQQTQPRSGGSFLSNLFGGSSSQSAPPPPPAYQPAYQPVNNPTPRPAAGPAWSAFGGQTATPPPFAQPMMYPAAPVYAAPAPLGGGFLRGALQTAAGVAAGEVAFAGMESLFRGFGGGGYGGGMGGLGGGGFEAAPREEIINNYYGDEGRHEEGRQDEHREESARDDDRSDFDSSSNDRDFDTSSDDTTYTSDDTGGGDDGSSY